MAVDIFDSLGSFKKIFIDNFGKTMRSPIWTSIFIVVIILCIFIFIFPKKDKNIFRMIKPTLYMFLSVILILFVHDSVVIDDVKDTQHERKIEETVDKLKLFKDRHEKNNIYEAMGGDATEEDIIEPRKHTEIGNNAYVAVTDLDETQDNNDCELSI